MMLLIDMLKASCLTFIAVLRWVRLGHESIKLLAILVPLHRVQRFHLLVVIVIIEIRIFYYVIVGIWFAIKLIVALL